MHVLSTVKLSEGANATYGAVQVYKNNKLHGVCDDNWTDTEAKVVCRALGFEDGLAIPSSGFGPQKETQIGLRSVRCRGDEVNLLQCRVTWDENCPTDMYASVYCSNITITQTGKPIKLSHICMK